MSTITDLLLDIAQEKNDYKIGEPWRFSEFSLAAVIPITRVVEIPRAYRLLSEVKDEVVIKDSGSINEMIIQNKYELPVLIKAGEILAGATQERTIVMSQFIMSGEKVTVPCACVHSSKGIRTGQQVVSDGFAPSQVRRMVYQTKTFTPDWNTSFTNDTWWYNNRTVNQSDVWGAVKDHSSRVSYTCDNFAAYMASSSDPVSVSTHWSTPSDDLAGRLKESKGKFEAVIKKVPKTENQVGFCLVTLDGFDTLDVFNHPESWEAVRKAILESEASNIADIHKDNPFQYSPEKAKAILSELLSANFEETKTVEKENSYTSSLESEQLKGEVVTLYNQPIHISLLRKA